jgi:hypothetical protein
VILVKGSNPVEVENYANIETQMVAKWARDNKISFNDQKSKVMIITKKRPRNRREIKIFNNNILPQADTKNYLGITIDRRLNFNQHIDKITGKSIKIVHALSRSVKINWGLRHDVLRIIYTGAILPILSYGAPVLSCTGCFGLSLLCGNNLQERDFPLPYKAIFGLIGCRE